MKASQKPTNQHQNTALPRPVVQPEAERLREPVGVAGERAEHHAADDHVVEVRHQEQAVVQLEVGRRDGQQHAAGAADDEGDDEADAPTAAASRSAACRRTA